MSRKGGFTDTGISKVIKALKNPPAARIGILAGSKARSQALAEALNKGAKASEIKKLRKEYQQAKQAGSGATNAEIGAAHEYGAPKRKLPARSWLRTPLIDHMAKEIQKNSKLARANFAHCAKDGTLMQVMGMIGVLAERIVRLGFTNGGYGKWRQLSSKYAATKRVKNILVETQQLRESVTHTVVRGG